VIAKLFRVQVARDDAQRQDLQRDRMNLVHRSVTDTVSRMAAAESGEDAPQLQSRPEARPPGEKQKTIVREGEKVGRNDPCPCGSGKKYKKCCGVSAATG